MRKLIPLLSVLALVLAGCSSIDCSMYNLVKGSYRFVGLDGDTTAMDGYFMTVTTTRSTDGNDTTLYNLQSDPHTLRIPMSYSLDADVLNFSLYEYDDSDYVCLGTDRVTISKTNQPRFESVDCSPMYFHTVTSVTSTHNFIDTVEIKNNSVDNDPIKEHFLIRVNLSE